jgi:hypothetical protein
LKEKEGIYKLIVAPNGVVLYKGSSFFGQAYNVILQLLVKDGALAHHTWTRPILHRWTNIVIFHPEA